MKVSEARLKSILNKFKIDCDINFSISDRKNLKEITVSSFSKSKKELLEMCDKILGDVRTRLGFCKAYYDFEEKTNKYIIIFKL